MTANQVAYQRNVETQRHNLEDEKISRTNAETNLQNAKTNWTNAKTEYAKAVVDADYKGAQKVIGAVNAVGSILSGGAKTIAALG